jgi:hypothetical protein
MVIFRTSCIMLVFATYDTTNWLRGPPSVISFLQLILLSEAFISPILPILDPSAWFKRAVVAKDAPTQSKMNECFAGDPVVMADAYTNCLTHLFISLAFFFILPFGIVISFAALCVNFWATKYMMLRRWRRPDCNMDESMALRATAFLMLFTVIHALFVYRIFLWWPLDNICSTTHESDPLAWANGSSSIMATEENRTFHACYGDMQAGGADAGSWLPNTVFMTADPVKAEGEQNLAVEYGQEGFFVVFVFLVCVTTSYAMGTSLVGLIGWLFYGVETESGDATDIEFFDCDKMTAYIPQMVQPGTESTDPLIACDLGLFDPKFIAWKGNYQKSNVWLEAELAVGGVGVNWAEETIHTWGERRDICTTANETTSEVRRINRLNRKLFSVCKQYPCSKTEVLTPKQARKSAHECMMSLQIIRKEEKDKEKEEQIEEVTYDPEFALHAEDLAEEAMKLLIAGDITSENDTKSPPSSKLGSLAVFGLQLPQKGGTNPMPNGQGTPDIMNRPLANREGCVQTEEPNHQLEAVIVEEPRSIGAGPETTNVKLADYQDAHSAMLQSGHLRVLV